MNIPLKLALVECETPAYVTAQKANISPNRLSRFVMEIDVPNETERTSLAKILKKSPSKLFPPFIKSKRKATYAK
jgi:hypothetical protein